MSSEKQTTTTAKSNGHGGIVAPSGQPAAQAAAEAEGFGAMLGARHEIARWLDQHDFTVGAVVQGKLLDAQLIADDERGYRAAYVLRLTRDLAKRPAKDGRGKDVKHPGEVTAAGACVMFGEKFNLKCLRNGRVGDEVRLRVTAIKDLEGGRTVMTFDVGHKPAKQDPAKSSPTLGALLAQAWKTGVAGKDAWEQEGAGPGLGATDDGAPF